MRTLSAATANADRSQQHNPCEEQTEQNGQRCEKYHGTADRIFGQQRQSPDDAQRLECHVPEYRHISMRR